MFLVLGAIDVAGSIGTLICPFVLVILLVSTRDWLNMISARKMRLYAPK